ncbi:hypothetical protein Tco_0561987 [Tanacetum coccineum]
MLGADGDLDDQAGGAVHWVYDHIIHNFQYFSHHDNLDPHLQIDPFPGLEADYPPYGYIGPVPSGYDYRYGNAPDGSS